MDHETETPGGGAKTPLPERTVVWRPQVLAAIATIAGTVWCSYHYTGEMFAAGLELLTSHGNPDAVKDGVIQLMSAVASNMVGVAAVTGLISLSSKLAEH